MISSIPTLGGNLCASILNIVCLKIVNPNDLSPTIKDPLDPNVYYFEWEVAKNVVFMQ